MTISLRNLPPEVAAEITAASRREGVSLNKATIRLLESRMGAPARAKRDPGYDKFLGRWSAKEADAFDASLREMRKVDPADWVADDID